MGFWATHWPTYPIHSHFVAVKWPHYGVPGNPLANLPNTFAFCCREMASLWRFGKPVAKWPNTFPNSHLQMASLWRFGAIFGITGPAGGEDTLEKTFLTEFSKKLKGHPADISGTLCGPTRRQRRREKTKKQLAEKMN